MTSKRSWPDYPLFAATLVLVIFGVIMVFDASYVRAGQSADAHYDIFFFLKRQAIWALIGFLALIFGMCYPYERLRRYSVILLLFSMVLLCLVFVPGIGIKANGATRWIGKGGFRFQPSELAKFALILYLAHTIASRRRQIRNLVGGLIPILIMSGVAISLVLVEPDMGTAVCMMAITLLMLALGGARKRHLALLMAVVLVLGVILILTEPYRIQRVIGILDPWGNDQTSGYQTVHSLIALGTGGLFGVGFGESRQKHLYLPAEHTDFIFAIIGEELGLVGTASLLFAFLMLTYRGFRIARQSKDLFALLLSGGLTSMITLQALLNIAVNTASALNTGVPLPFISYGGTSIVVMMASVGVLLNISQHTHPSEEGATRENRPERRGHGRTRIPGPERV